MVDASPSSAMAASLAAALLGVSSLDLAPPVTTRGAIFRVRSYKNAKRADRGRRANVWQL
jgi:hypothetical protein